MTELHPIKRLLLMLILAGPIAYVFSILLESQILPSLDEASIFFWLAVAIIEESVKWTFVRHARFTSGLYFILAISTLESLFYAIYFAQYFWEYHELLWLAFFYVLLIRWILNGHILFYLAGVGITRATNRTPSEWQHTLRMTGRNVNIIGWTVGVMGHLYWNWTQVSFTDKMPFLMVLAAMSLLALYGLHATGALKQLMQ